MSEMIAPVVDLHAQAVFNLAQGFVELATQVGQALIVSGLEHDVARMRLIYF